METGVRLALVLFVVVTGFSIGQAAEIGPASKLDHKLPAECAGSYALDKNHIIDIGPMDEMGGDLVFLDSQTLREGHLHQVAESEFVAGPTLGVDDPATIRITFRRDRRKQIDSLRWDGDGIHNAVAKRIAPHKTEPVEVRNGDDVLRGELLVPATGGRRPATGLAHGAGPATRHLAMWDAFMGLSSMPLLSRHK